MAPPSKQKRLQFQLQDYKAECQRLESEKTTVIKTILFQSPIWIASVAGVMLTGALHSWRDIEILVFSMLVASPAILVPIFFLDNSEGPGQTPWWQSYWLKLNIWVGIVVIMGTYMGTAYFFDLMGMRYSFDVRWTFSSDVVGKSQQQVPVFMYPLTHAYFMTYFAALMASESFLVRRCGIRGVWARRTVVVLLSYTLAFLETYFMASPFLSDFFAYKSRSRMLTLGSWGYASYFFVGLPMVQRIDGDGVRWTLERVVVEALATCMMILFLLEAWGKIVGPL
ncbi:hypothetical protein QBC34DRAFT_102685 [Podospora aff. communis PSN243]|uniref:Cycloeucalenol cycloisomerase n=1 Tax=Podospora aff. communis PSN243 TaxID=3040156 RepID=A0AAV9GKS6_9PEZI|nr:hypothetical protein QBC34DRAFT_102685 [Podospora aff. communis PSN243]